MPALDLRPPLKLPLDRGLLPGEAGRRLAIVPKIGLRGLLFEGIELRGQGGEVKDAPVVRKSPRRSFSVCRPFHPTCGGVPLFIDMTRKTAAIITQPYAKTSPYLL